MFACLALVALALSPGDSTVVVSSSFSSSSSSSASVLVPGPGPLASVDPVAALPVAASSASAPAQSAAPDAGLGAIFARHGVDGGLWVENLAGTEVHAWRPKACEQGFLPASTFKILNSLIALEVGAVADVDEELAWDGVDRGWTEWNRDHSMRTAIRVSAVWFYQELARRVGAERMRELVAKAGYGNRDVAGAIDTFWLDGAIRITPREQVAFLERLYRGDLPFREEHLAAVREILEVERGDDYVLRAKSGWAVASEPGIGWHVGWVERGDDAWFFAAFVEIRDHDQAQADARKKVSRDALAGLGLLPAAPPRRE